MYMRYIFRRLSRLFLNQNFHTFKRITFEGQGICMETQLRAKMFKLILYSYGIKRMERHDKYIGSVEKNFFPKTTKKKNKKKTKKSLM